MIMRNFTLYRILSALTVAAVLGGCSINERSFSPEPEGTPIDFTLRYMVDGSTVYTKAAQDSVSENQVNNLLILIFDSNGNRIRWDDGTAVSYYFANNGSEITDYHPYGGQLDPTTGTVQLTEVPSTNSATIIGIANLTTDYTTTSFTIRRETLEAVGSLEELGRLVMPMREESVERSALFMMTGRAVSGTSDRININNSNLDSDGNLACTLELERVDAKVRVIVEARAPEGDGTISNMTFEPKTWRVMRVPRQSLLLPYEDSHEDNIGTMEGPWDDRGHWDASAEEFGYSSAGWFDSGERNFEESMTETEDNTVRSYGGSFVFYMPESRRRYKGSIREAMPAADAAARYAMREESNTKPYDGEGNGKPGQEYSNVNFKYADDNAPYLILTGYLTYDRALDDGTSRVVSADVRYIVHLGSDVANADDYDTRRNGYYTYKITIQGVNSMVVEVTGGDDGVPTEQRPGYEGDLSYSINEVFVLDSHYDRSLLKLNPASVTDLMTWSVRTQFSHGFVYDPSVEGTAEYRSYLDEVNGVDYRWVKFVIHQLRNRQGINPQLTSENYAPYPGEASFGYNPNGYAPDWNPDDWQYADGYDAVPQAMDVHQLIKFLKKVKAEGEAGNGNGLSDLAIDGDIVITAFVDENVTVYRPGSTSPELTLWKEMVDTDTRQLHILTPEDDRIFSPDGNTSMVQSSYTFVQRAIRTLYDKDSDVTTAWGLESTMEAVHPGPTDSLRLEPGNVSAGTSTSNGRWNTWQILQSAAPGRKWSDIIHKSTRYGLNSGYDQAIYACLLRNRDLDGDDVIDAFELRWYLAAIDQLTDIYIGEWALDEASRLYPQEAALRPGGNQQYWHYTSSSYDASSNGPWVLWAEEGASRGSYSASKTNNGSKYAYRCIRNLGFSITQEGTIAEDEEPQDYIQVQIKEVETEYSSSGKTYDYILDMSRMNPAARRSVSDGGMPLPAHDIYDITNNKPYKSFLADHRMFGVTPEPEKIYVAHNGSNDPEHDDMTLDLLEYSTEAKAYVEWPQNKRGSWQDFQGIDNPCPEGYRMPNQREMLIMTTRLTSDNQWPTYDIYTEYYTGTREWYIFYYSDWSHVGPIEKWYYDARPLYRPEGNDDDDYLIFVSQTAFSIAKEFEKPYENRGGFIWNFYDKAFMLQNTPHRDYEKGYVRCVKDTE